MVGPCHERLWYIPVDLVLHQPHVRSSFIFISTLMRFSYLNKKNYNAHGFSHRNWLSRRDLDICMVRVMMFSAIFNNISVTSWRSVLLPGETRVAAENHRPVASYFYHLMLYRVHLAWMGFELSTLVVIGTDCTGSCKSNYHTITTTTVTSFS